VTGTGRNRLSFANVPVDRATAYAAEAADVALRLWQMLKPQLRGNKALALYELTEKKMIPVLVAMEEAGVRVDRGDLQAMSKEFEGRMADFEIEIFRLAGRNSIPAAPSNWVRYCRDAEIAGRQKE